MKNIHSAFLWATLAMATSACEMDKGILPEIQLKKGVDYISNDTILESGSYILIGVTAKKSETRDVLKKFNISKSVNGGNQITVYSHDLISSEEDYYSYNYEGNLVADSSDVVLYTFTITNRDGLVNQAEVEITID